MQDIYVCNFGKCNRLLCIGNWLAEDYLVDQDEDGKSEAVCIKHADYDID